MIYFVCGIVLWVSNGFLCVSLADRKGYYTTSAFFYGAILGIFGLIYFAGLPVVQAQESIQQCPECGCQMKYYNENAYTRYKPIKAAPIVITVVAIIVGVFIFMPKGVGGLQGYDVTALQGKDKLAYEIIIKCSYSFKNPSSVRLISGGGNILEKHEVLLARVSASNGFGATTSSYCALIGKTGDIGKSGDILSYDDRERSELENEFFHDTTTLNIAKINAALDAYWGK